MKERGREGERKGGRERGREGGSEREIEGELKEKVIKAHTHRDRDREKR